MNRSVMAAIEAEIWRIGDDSSLYAEVNFASRAAALDALEFHLIDRLDGLLGTIDSPEELLALKAAAERIGHQLEAVDAALFQRLRVEIQAGVCAGPVLAGVIEKCVGCPGPAGGMGYDTLDLFLNGLLLAAALPTETKTREAEMVFYQQTPARIIMELVARASLTAEDVFYDIGSGLGQVPILVHLLSGATAKGIEFEPAYWAYARACADDLHLSGVEFVYGDARAADFTDGTVFFLYSPFVGAMLQAVLAKLREVSKQKAIRIFTYGPCTEQVAGQSWLQWLNPNEDTLYQLAEFNLSHNVPGTF